MFLRKLFGLVPSDPFTKGLDLFDRGHLRQAVAAFAPLLDSSDDAIRGKAALYTCEAYLQLGDAIATYRRERWLDRLHYRMEKTVPSMISSGFDRYRDRPDDVGTGKRLSLSGMFAVLRAEIYRIITRYGYEITRNPHPER